MVACLACREQKAGLEDTDGGTDGESVKVLDLDLGDRVTLIGKCDLVDVTVLTLGEWRGWRDGSNQPL